MKQVKENAVVSADSHTYKLNKYTVGNKGLEVNGVDYLNLVRGSKEDDQNIILKQDGFLIEQLLWIAPRS